MKAIKFKLTERKFQKTIKQYSKVSNLNLGEIIQKRGTRIIFKLIEAYRDKAPSKSSIENLANTLGGKIRIRTSIDKKKAKRSTKIKREIAARKRSIFYTSLGWLYAAKLAGLPIRKKVPAKFGNTEMGKGKAKLKGNRPYITVENILKAATILDKKGNIIRSVLKAETKDMQQYIQRKTLKKHNKKFNR